MGFEIRSPDFDHQGAIPMRFTCEGQNLSPALSWSGVPEGARTLALVVEDPDAPDPRAPKMVFVHWVLFDIPAEASGLPEAAGNGGAPLPAGTRSGRNDWGRLSWGGPCPPVGRHRYFHRLYALDAAMELSEPTRAELGEAMSGHVLGLAELVGTYLRQRGGSA